MSNVQRELLLDVIRFYAIALVVFGHAIQYNETSYINNYVFKIIYSFHMPLFMFIAGYVSYNSLKRKTLIEIIQFKFYNLYLPFFISSIIYLSYKSNFNTPDMINLLIYPDTGYWFLYVLFCIYIIFKILLQLYRWNKFLPLAIYIGLYTLPSDYLALGLMKFHLIFFITGYFTYEYKNSLLLLYQKYKNLSKYIIIFFLITASFYPQDGSAYYISENYLPIQKIIIYCIKVLTAFLGIISVFYLSSLFRINSFLSIVGQKYTMHIYIIHIYFITTISSSSHSMNTIINFIIALTASILIAKFFELKYLNILHKLLFGMKK